MPQWNYAEGDAKRKDFMTFWITDNNTETISKSNLAIIGKGIEDMPISSNAETEESQDVLGNNNYEITGYAKSMTVDPMKISGDNKYSQHLDDLFERDATLSELHNFYLCVKRYKTDASGKARAWVQEGVVEPGDFASGLAGVSTSHTVHYVGAKTFGVVDLDTLEFTPDGASSGTTTGLA